jgi:hypothetical protein
VIRVHQSVFCPSYVDEENRLILTDFGLDVYAAASYQVGPDVSHARPEGIVPCTFHDRSLTVTYEPLRQPHQRTAERSTVTVYDDNHDYLTITAGGRLLYDSRIDIPCDMDEWQATWSKYHILYLAGVRQDEGFDALTPDYKKLGLVD